jgi:hypothetical protein
MTSVADPDLFGRILIPAFGTRYGSGSGFEATKTDIFLPFFVLESFMNT